MLQNAYFLAKIGADTAENEQHFAENLPTGRRGPEVGAPPPARREPGGHAAGDPEEFKGPVELTVISSNNHGNVNTLSMSSRYPPFSLKRP